jgi:hypothetical protein
MAIHFAYRSSLGFGKWASLCPISLNAHLEKEERLSTQTVFVDEQDAAKPARAVVAPNRWMQLIAGVVAMIVISNYQYAFTLFSPGMKQTFTGVPYAKIAAVFAALIAFETWLMPASGWFIDKFGIRKLMILGLVGCCQTRPRIRPWTCTSTTARLPELAAALSIFLV